ncbi:MAG: hypothetical protein JNM28_03250 [Armatimonadetes bacterium]|nr:hypothetical protein [Armatimonadota bacterium]MBS1711191.1 hypothetical protein [Armatimonadota bacterium]MBX3108865.1 hypothetical protein [Fimbriimonadaceae bacterium]
MNSGFKFGIVVFAAVMLACCGGFMLLLSPITSAVNKKEKEAKGFGDAYTRQILRGFDAGVLTSLATKEYRAEFSKEAFQKSLDANKSALGDFVSGKGSASIKSAKKEGKDPVIHAVYQNRATFERGKAKVRIDLVFQDDKWSIEQFAIEPN